MASLRPAAGLGAVSAALYYVVLRAQHPRRQLQTMVTFWPNLLVSEFSHQLLLLLLFLAVAVGRKGPRVGSLVRGLNA